MRRRILRALDQDRTPQALPDIALGLGEGLSTVSYHVLVLRDCGSIAVSGVESAYGTLSSSFVSLVTENGQVTEALKATERLDDGH